VKSKVRETGRFAEVRAGLEGDDSDVHDQDGCSRLVQYKALEYFHRNMRSMRSLHQASENDLNA
jgi:hypothetical protein